MKTTLGSALFFLAAAAASAEFPEGAYMVSQIDEACALAVKERKPVALFVTNTELRNSNVINAQRTAMKSLLDYAVVVVVEEEKGEKFHLSPPAYNVLFDRETFGKYYPHGKLCTPDFIHEWGTITYGLLKEKSAAKALKEIEELSAERLKLWDPDEARDELYRRQHRWPGNDGKYYSGKFRALDDKRLHVTGPAGQHWNYSRSVLGVGSITFAKQMATHKVRTSFEVETWTSSDGKELTATFIDLGEAGVVLALEGGKRVTVPGQRLDAASQERAMEYAEKLKKVGG